MRLQAIGAAVLLALSVNASANDEPGWAKLTGSALQVAFADVELGDDIHFTYRFHSDGSFEGTEMGKHVAGTWHTTIKQFCWRWTQPPSDEECHTIKSNGRSIRAYRNGMEVWSGDVTPLHQ